MSKFRNTVGSLFGAFLCLIAFSTPAPAADYAAQFVSESQSPEGLNLPYVAGQTATFQLSYKNTGTVYWTNTRDVSDAHSIELRSVTAADSTIPTDSPLYPGQGPAPLWVNRQRVVGPSQSRVDPNQAADFVFTVKIPATAGHYRLYFRPCIYGNFVGQGRYFDLEVTQPSVTSPSDLIALADGTSANLTWSDKSNNEDGFHIQRKIGDTGTWTTIATVEPNIESYPDGGLSPNKTYYYQVRAYAGTTNSEWSNTYYALTMETPLWFSATVTSVTSIDLSWYDASNNETGFKVYQRTDTAAPWVEIADLPTETSAYGSRTYPDTGLTPGTTYFYGIRAYANSTTLTPHFSAMATTSATTGTENVAAPTDLIALANGLAVDLTWKDNSGNEDGFRIEKKIGNNGAFSPFKTLAAGTTSYRDTDVSANWKYFYRVCAYKGSTVSEWVEYYAQILAAPANLTATVKSQTGIDLVWADNTLGETGFKVYRKLASDAQWTEIAVLTPQTANYTSFSDKEPAFDTTYYYGVRAYADSTTPTPHLSEFATVSATTQGLSTEPNWVKTYRLVKAANGHQDHLYTTKLEEKNSAEAAGYMFDGEDFMVSSTPFVGCSEVVRLRKDGPGYVIRLYTSNAAEIDSASAQGYVRESPSLGYVYAVSHLGMAEIKRCFHQGITDRFYTAYEQEFARATANGYREENPLGYAPSGVGHAPIRPEAVSPAPSPCVAIPPTLQASPFNDPDPGDRHVATCWQATSVRGNFDSANLVLSRVDDPSNLTTIIPDANMLSKGRRYWWRVLYKDASSLRSSWSPEASFVARCYAAAPKALTVDGPEIEQRNCQGHYQKFSFDALAGNQYVVTLTPVEGDPDLFGSATLSHLDQLPNPPAGTLKSGRPPGRVERLTIQPEQSGPFYVAGFGATECLYRISVSTSAKAVISASRRDVISGGSIRFDGSGSSPSGAGGAITSYNWTFTDGSSATSAVVDHIFYCSFRN